MSVTQIGVFARCFCRDSAEAVADAVRSAGFTLVQFNFSAIRQPTLNAYASPDDLRAVEAAFRRRGIAIWGLSATFNAIHPDRVARSAATQRAARLIAMSHLLGVKAVTLCTGTRDAGDMWAGHPENTSAAAWHDLRATLDILIPAAAAAGVKLGIEPEPGNVISDARRARRLLRELGNDAASIGIVLDPGNLITPATLGAQREILSEAFDLVAEQLICLHAKDLGCNGPTALGAGCLDYDLIITTAQRLQPPVPVIIQDVAEADAPRSRAFLRNKLDTADAR